MFICRAFSNLINTGLLLKTKMRANLAFILKAISAHSEVLLLTKRNTLPNFLRWPSPSRLLLTRLIDAPKEVEIRGYGQRKLPQQVGRNSSFQISKRVPGLGLESVGLLGLSHAQPWFEIGEG